MKKLIAILMTLALLAGVSTTALAYSDKNLEAPKAGEVVIDGDLGEWDTTKCLKINAQNQIIDQIEHWDGEADCSMETYVMWDEENLYIAMKILDDTPLVYREGFPLDELDAVIFFLSTDPEADPARIADTQGWDTQGEYGDEVVFDDYEAAIASIDGGIVWESKIPLHNLSNKNIPQLVPEAGKTIGFDVSILDVDLPCPGIHSLRMQYSSELDGRDRKPEMHAVDTNPSLWATLTFVD